jgi:peptidylprolyl isomerase
MIFEFEKAQVPPDMGEPEVGMQLHLSDNEGNHLPVVITAVTENAIILDGNHPLAGKDLTFDIEVVSIGE